MLPVQWVSLTQPHQTDEQHYRPQNLHQEADLNGYKVPINTQISTYGNLMYVSYA